MARRRSESHSKQTLTESSVQLRSSPSTTPDLDRRIRQPPIKGRYSLTHGTGRYRGITGSGTYVGHRYGYLARTKKNQCDMRSEPTAEVFKIAGKGTLD
jgi:hypothetical protein